MSKKRLKSLSKELIICPYCGTVISHLSFEKRVSHRIECIMTYDIENYKKCKCLYDLLTQELA